MPPRYRREQRGWSLSSEGIGIAIFVTLAIGAAVILIRNRRSRWVTSWTKFRGYTDWQPLGAFSSEIMVACCVYTPEDDKALGVRVLMRGQLQFLSGVGSAPRRRESSVEEDSTRRVVD